MKKNKWAVALRGACTLCAVVAALASVALGLYRFNENSYDMALKQVQQTAGFRVPGSAVFEHTDTEISAVTERADNALYEVKRAGRDGYRIYTRESG